MKGKLLKRKCAKKCEMQQKKPQQQMCKNCQEGKGEGEARIRKYSK